MAAPKWRASFVIIIRFYSKLTSGKYDEQLISLVQSKPPLYDYRLPTIERSKLKKQDIWQIISNNFRGQQFTPKSVEKRWNYLKDNYLKARKKYLADQYAASKSGSAATTSPLPSFRYYKIMDFLNDSVTYKTTISSFKISKKKSITVTKQTSVSKPASCTEAYKENVFGERNPEPELVDDEEANDGQLSFEVPTTPQPILSTPSNNNKRSPLSPLNIQNIGSSANTTPCTSKRKKNTSDIENQLVKMLQKDSKEADEVDGFLMRLGASLHRLSYQKRAKLEIKFLTLVNEAEELENKETFNINI